jgi:hypothetical protein
MVARGAGPNPTGETVEGGTSSRPRRSAAHDASQGRRDTSRRAAKRPARLATRNRDLSAHNQVLEQSNARAVEEREALASTVAAQKHDIDVLQTRVGVLRRPLIAETAYSGGAGYIRGANFGAREGSIEYEATHPEVLRADSLGKLTHATRSTWIATITGWSDSEITFVLPGYAEPGPWRPATVGGTSELSDATQMKSIVHRADGQGSPEVRRWGRR